MPNEQAPMSCSARRAQQFVGIFVAFYMSVVVDGHFYAFGLLKLEMEKEYPEISTEFISLIGGLYATCYLLFAPIGMAILAAFGLKTVSILGTSLHVLGFALAFLGQWVKWGFVLDVIFVGILPGIGGALMFGPSIVGAPDQYGKDAGIHKAITTSIATSGSPAGALLYGFLFKYFLMATPFGWRGVMMFYAIMAAVIIPLSFTFYKLPEDPLPAGQSKPTAWERFKSKAAGQFTRRIWSCKNKAFLAFLTSTSFAVLGYPVATLLVNTMAKDPKMGISDFTERNLIFFWGISNVIGRLTLGSLPKWANRSKILFSSYSIYVASQIVSAADVSLFPLYMSSGDAAFIFFIVSYGFISAPIMAIRSTYLGDLFYPSDDKTTEQEANEIKNASFGWQLVSDGVFAWLGFYLSTMLNNTSPLYSCLFAGATLLLGAITLALTYQPYFKGLNSRLEHARMTKLDAEAAAAEQMPLKDVPAH